jgi:hypothetical protein
VKPADDYIGSTNDLKRRQQLEEEIGGTRAPE